MYQRLAYRFAPASRTVVIIGDCVAEGIGDSLGQGGLAPRMGRLFRELRTETSLRLRWSVVSVGRLYTTSKDWTPGAGRLEDVLVKGPLSKAEVVAYVAGSHDDPADAAQSIQNVVQTAKAIALLGKHVVVSAMPNYEAPQSPLYETCRERSRMVVSALNEAAEELPDNAGSIMTDVDIGKVLARRADVIRVENRFITLNSFGYRAFARELFDEVAKAAKKVEWAYWKVRLREPAS